MTPDRRSARTRAGVGAVGTAMAVASVAIIGAFIVRGGAGTDASVEFGGRTVTITCMGGPGTAEGCAAWGASVLEDGPRTRTFEPEDVSRVEIRAGSDAAECEVHWFLSRYPDEAVARETWSCP